MGGVAVLAKAELGVSDVSVGLEGEPDPDEARWVEATVGGVRVVSVYVPNGRELSVPRPSRPSCDSWKQWPIEQPNWPIGPPSSQGT